MGEEESGSVVDNTLDYQFRVKEYTMVNKAESQRFVSIHKMKYANTVC